MSISVCLIGEESLLIQCGNILLSRKHFIYSVISPIKAIAEWAETHKIPHFKTIAAFLKDKSLQVDYIFSIVNSQILPASFLKLARFNAINYHDSLLPKYAGLNATSWAILHEESEHGITWHVMNEKIDEGDIIQQVKFPVYSYDSALTLNLRCYEKAISSFNEIIILIENKKLYFKKQNLNQQSYYAANHTLPCFGFINWQTMSAKKIQCLHRALNLGDYNNNIGSLKILTKNDYFIVSDLSISITNKISLIPGQILAINEALIVATISSIIQITKIRLKSGKLISIKSLAEQNNLQVGQVLPYFNENQATLWQKFVNFAYKSEHFWVNQIKLITEHNSFPIKYSNKEESLKLLSPISLSKLFPNQTFANQKILLFTAILIYLYRINDYEPIAISLVHPNYSALTQLQGNFFSHFLPFYFKQEKEVSLEEVLIYVEKNLFKLEKNLFFVTDILARHPILIESSLDPGIVINLDIQSSSPPLQEDTLLYFYVDSKRGEINVFQRINLDFNDAELSQIILNMSEHLSNILVKLINHSSTNISDFCFLAQSEKNKLLKEWGVGVNYYIPSGSIATQFEKKVSLHPEKIALYFGKKGVTYRQLNEYADQIASYLHSVKILKQTFVGIYLNRGIELIAVILGILKSDCVYVPLDTKYPILKLEQIIEDANLTILIVEENLINYFKEFLDSQKRIINTVTVEHILYNKVYEISPPSKKKHFPTDLAYIMFTSGTTGRSKGVMVSHDNILNYCKWFSETTGFNETNIIDFSSSIAFDLSIPCTLAPLLAGGSIAIANAEQKANPEYYLEYLKYYKITHAELTPGYVEILLNHPEEIKNLIDLRFLLLGADIVPTSDVVKWLSLCPWHQIINEYGPTETTVSATSYFVNQKLSLNKASLPIGRPAYNTTCYVLDKYKNLCPAGMKGELYIGGAQVAQGYFNRPELTAKKFIKANFIRNNELVYRTGDLVCWLPDGNLQFFGRNDYQVKIQGYRIELAAIESILIKIPDIQQAIVIVKTGNLNEKFLRAYLVNDKKNLSSMKIRSFLSSYLPHYMIPREYCVIQSVPLRENEKIDFIALEKQTYELLLVENALSTKHLTSDEIVVKKIWEQVFHSNDFSINDNFFEKGGDSLMAMQMVAELKAHYGLHIPLQILFEFPTIKDLVNQICNLSYNNLKVRDNRLLHAVVKLAKGTEKIPLFLVHPVGGSIFWYQKLAILLSGKYTVYGIQDLSLEGNKIRFKTLEKMAEFYLEEIAKVYEGNNYRIGGASFGATVAFEMAHQLIKKGKKIEFLGLFDGWAYYPDNIMRENSLDWLTQSEENLLINRDELNKLEHYRKNLLINYKLTTLSVNATLFKASDLLTSFGSIDNESNGWEPFIQGNLKIYLVSGNHETIFFEPNVHYLAKCISHNLELKQKRLSFESRILEDN